MLNTLPRFLLRLGAAAVLLTMTARAQYHRYNNVANGSDCIMQDYRSPNVPGGIYDAIHQEYHSSSDGGSGYFYGGFTHQNNVNGSMKTLVQYVCWPASGGFAPYSQQIPIFAGTNMVGFSQIGEGSSCAIKGYWPQFSTTNWYREAVRYWQPADGTPHLGYQGIWMKEPVSGNWYHVGTFLYPFAVTGVNGMSGWQEKFTGQTLDYKVAHAGGYYHINGAWSRAHRIAFSGSGYTYSTNDATYPGLYAESDAGPSFTNLYNVPSTIVLTGQPTTPAFDPILVTNAVATVYGSQLLVQWEIPPRSSPQLGYLVEVFDNPDYTNSPAVTFFDREPETRQKLLNLGGVLTPYVRLTISDIFFNTNAPVLLTPATATLSPATNVTGTVGGLAYQYFEAASGSWTSLPDFAALTPKRRGAVGYPDTTPRQRRVNYGFTYAGFFNAPSDGLYAFTLHSGDGSVLTIDGTNVISFDGLHDSTQFKGGGIALAAGAHSFALQFFKGDVNPVKSTYYNDGLGLAYEGPGIAPTDVPASAFSRLPAPSEPAITLTAPLNNATVPNAAPGFAASVTTNGVTVNAVQFFLSDFYSYYPRPARSADYFIGQDTTAPFEFNSLIWAAPTNLVRARLIYNGTNSIDSAPATIATTNSSFGDWYWSPLEFRNYPSGASAQPQSARLLGDGMNLLSRQVAGDCTLIAHLAGITKNAAGPDGLWPDGNWRAGIILRGNTNTTIGEPLGSQSRGRFAALFGTVNNGTYFQDDTMRAGNGDANRWSANLGGSYRWFKLQRLGDSFISSVSPDGVGWTVVNSTNLPGIGAKIYAGLFTHAEQSMNPNIHSASFDNFSLTGTNVLGPASVSISPLSYSAIGGQSATFTAFIIGSVTAGFQWQLNGTNLVGATNATLTIPSVTAADLGNYTVIANSVTSAPAILTLAATVIWNGGGTNANWTTAANWTGNAPADGDVLVFQGTQRQNNTNNLLSSAGQIVFSNGGFTLRGNPLTLQGGLVNVSGNNTHNLATTLTAPQSFVSSNGTLTVSGGVANGGFNLTFDGAGSNVVNWPITGSGAVIKMGAGSATLSPAHYFTGGTIVNAGTLYLAYNNSVSGAGTLQGTLTVNSNALAVCSVNNALGWTGDNWVRNITLNYGTLRTDVATDNGWGTTIKMIGGNLTAGVANGYFAMGNSPVFNVTGTNIPSVISANLTVRDAAPGGIVFNVTRGPAATDLNLSGKLLSAGTGGITLNGGGIAQLTGTNTYTGPTFVNAGTLLVNSPGSLAAGSAVTVASGGTLGGSGTVNGAVTNSGTLSPGNNGVGTLTTGGETWNGGGSLLCEINSTNATGCDRVAITGTLNLQSSAGSPFTIRLASLTSGGAPGVVTNFDKLTSYAWTIATASAGILNFATNKFTFDTSAFGNDFSGGTWSVATNGNSLLLQFTAANPPLLMPTVTGFGPWSNGSCPLIFGGPSGQSYTLRASTNLTLPLRQWIALTTGVFKLDPVTYTDTKATNDWGFYRVSSP